MIAGLAIAAIGLHLVIRFGLKPGADVAGFPLHDVPLVTALAFGGVPLLVGLTTKVFRREFGSDLLAGISIVTSALLGEYLAGSLVVLMLSGGAALEGYAVRHASSVLQALAKRMPSASKKSIMARVPSRNWS